MFIEIVSPEKTIYTGDVSSVFLPGTEGFFQVLDNVLHCVLVDTCFTTFKNRVYYRSRDIALLRD